MSPDNEREQEQKQDNRQPAQSANEPADDMPGADKQADQASATTGTEWSWGAFMFDPAFLIAIQKYVYLLVYLLMLIPVLNFIVWIGFKIYLGLKGREMARGSATFASAEQREGFFKGFDWAGKVLFFVGLAFFVLGLLLSLVFGISAMNAMPGPGGGFSG
jgi:hypothetical protein